MKEYKKGQKFKVCGHDELLKKGWIHDSGNCKYSHEDFPNCSINEQMIEDFEGETFTVKANSHRDDWYIVEEEDSFIWPVATFLTVHDCDDGIILSCEDGCEEGMTEIDGWIICKHCGTDLRKIR